MKTYQKHNSFAGIRHQNEQSGVLPRIQQIYNKLQELSLSEYVRSVVERACKDLLAPNTGRGDAPRFSLHSNVIEEINRINDRDLPRYLFYRYRYEIYPQLREVDSFPPCLQIEPTSICNYRCVFCYQTDETFNKKSDGHMGVMSLDLFKRLIDQAVGQCEALTLSTRGEPLVCPTIKQMLAYVGGKFLASKMNTNASLLDEEKCHAILQADLNTVVFSVDAASEPMYSQLRVGGNLDRVRSNIELFHDIRATRYPHSRTITRVSGVKVDGTPDLDQMEKFWGGLVDQVAFVNYNPWENTYREPINQIKSPCTELFLRMFVWWDGTVNPCENDYKSNLTVGNATEHGLSDLWRSENYSQIRENHLNERRSHCAPCNRCTVV
jgi:radical SAM protein with 4Fe4S-binding SPASM domain